MEPPYTEPYVRWCERTAGVNPPPTRLPSEAGRSGLLKEAVITPIRGKIIRIAGALPATEGSEGSKRK